jgi:hypothetical protein
MADESSRARRRGGRPRVHSGETTVISFRVAKRRGTHIAALLAAIKLADQRSHDPDSAVLVEALEQRLRGLANRNPQLVERMLRGF